MRIVGVASYCPTVLLGAVAFVVVVLISTASTTKTTQTPQTSTTMLPMVVEAAPAATAFTGTSTSTNTRRWLPSKKQSIWSVPPATQRLQGTSYHRRPYSISLMATSDRSPSDMATTKTTKTVVDETSVVEDSTSNEKPEQEGDGQRIDTPKDDVESLIDAASKFKVVTCSATSCAAKRKKLAMDEYATFSAFYTRIHHPGATNDHDADNDNDKNHGKLPHVVTQTIRIEECSCLGVCKYAPAVGIEHEEYDGPVSIGGMTPNEFDSRAFYSVLSTSDVDRVWHSLQDAIRVMSTLGDDNDGNDEDEDEQV